jgi:MFS family permease
LGIGDWAQSPIPNPQSPSPIIYSFLLFNVLIFGVIGAFVCYVLAAVSPVPVIGLIGCAFTGLCVSMLWPGNLIVSAEKFPNGGVLMYALMAAGGDMGAALGPQLVGSVTDLVIASKGGVDLALKLGLGIEQLGMKAGILAGSLFPLLAIPLYLIYFKKKHNR